MRRESKNVCRIEYDVKRICGGGWFFFFKQKTAYEIGTGDWSSDVCSSDLKVPKVPYLEMGGSNVFLFRN